jgi:hypothetical protein
MYASRLLLLPSGAAFRFLPRHRLWPWLRFVTFEGVFPSKQLQVEQNVVRQLPHCGLLRASLEPLTWRKVSIHEDGGALLTSLRPHVLLCKVHGVYI